MTPRVVLVVCCSVCDELRRDVEALLCGLCVVDVFLPSFWQPDIGHELLEGMAHAVPGVRRVVSAKTRENAPQSRRETASNTRNTDMRALTLRALQHSP